VPADAALCELVPGGITIITAAHAAQGPWTRYVPSGSVQQARLELARDLLDDLRGPMTGCARRKERPRR